MNITANRKLESSTSETMTLTLKWDPTNTTEEGLIATIAMVINMAERLQVLEKALKVIEDSDENV